MPALKTWLDRHAAGEVRMLPPTVVSLEQLAELRGLDPGLQLVDVREPNEAVCILLLKHVDIAFATTHVQAFARRIIEQIVGVADDVK